jgi:hypothetical protein
MFMLRKLLLALCVLAFCDAAFALESNTSRLLSFVWPNSPAERVDEIGRGVGIVFSPDLSVVNNCNFYKTLGFACFQDSDWSRVLGSIRRYNADHPGRRIHTLLLETHGTNGNGLKLQRSSNPQAERSYISVGALQERLESQGIFKVIISACNAGRLLRPHIYKELDPYNGDKLFLPATCGIFNASRHFDPQRSPVLIIRGELSHIETTLVGQFTELGAGARKSILVSAKALKVKAPREFAISEMLVQMLTRDPRLQLVTNSAVDDLSRNITPNNESEELFRRFVTYLNAVAAQEGMRSARANTAGGE